MLHWLMCSINAHLTSVKVPLVLVQSNDSQNGALRTTIIPSSYNVDTGEGLRMGPLKKFFNIGREYSFKRSRKYSKTNICGFQFHNMTVIFLPQRVMCW